MDEILSGNFAPTLSLLLKGKKISVVSILLSSLSSRMMLTILLYRNFIKMSSQLNCMVPLFDGSNYCTWATNMTAFLCSQHLWGIVSGRESRPSDLPSGRAAVVATSQTPAQPAIPAPTQEKVSERQRLQREWMEKDEQALGMIQLWLSHNSTPCVGLVPITLGEI